MGEYSLPHEAAGCLGASREEGKGLLGVALSSMPSCFWVGIVKFSKLTAEP